MVVFVLSVALIVLTSFVGIRPSGFQILPNQYSSVRITASDSFSYQAKILTAQKRAQLINEVPHVYRIDMTSYEEFKEHTETLLSEICLLYTSDAADE